MVNNGNKTYSAFPLVFLIEKYILKIKSESPIKPVSKVRDTNKLCAPIPIKLNVFPIPIPKNMDDIGILFKKSIAKYNIINFELKLSSFLINDNIKTEDIIKKTTIPDNQKICFLFNWNGKDILLKIKW